MNRIEQNILIDAKEIKTVIKSSEMNERRRYFKREARHAIFKRQNWSKLIFSTLICLLIISSVRIATDSLFDIFSFTANELNDYIFSYIRDIIYIILAVPLIYGYITFCCNMLDEEFPSIGDMFIAFNSGKILTKAYKIFTAYVSVYFLLAASVIFGLNIIMTLKLSIYVTAIIVFGSIIAFSIGFVFVQQYYMVLYNLIKDEYLTTYQAVKLSVQMMKGHKIEVIALNSGFIIWFLLSYFTLGILTVLFTLPYFILTNLEFAKFIYTKNLTLNITDVKNNNG